MLSTVPGSWLERLSTEFAYQWRRCDASGWACVDIPGATSPNYVPTVADQGHALRARVTGSFAGTSDQGTPQDSESTAVIAAAPPTVRSHRVASLTAGLRLRRTVSVRALMKRGLSVRVHCSLPCSLRLDLTGRGGVELAHLKGSLQRAGSRTFTLRLSRKAKRIIRRFHSGTLALRLEVQSRDGERQTVARTLHLRR
jgi:hypothetical protein